MPEVIIILPWKGLWYAGWWPSSWKVPEVSITSECQQANVRGCCVPCNWSIYRTALSWWRHQMETFSALLALCAGNSPVPVNSPHKGQWRGAWMFSLISACINAWVNNREAGDLRRHRGHYDAIVTYCFNSSCFNSSPPGQNVRHFADDIFKCIFLNENVWISLKFSLKFIPNVRINSGR